MMYNRADASRPGRDTFFKSGGRYFLFLPAVDAVLFGWTSRPMFGIINRSEYIFKAVCHCGGLLGNMLKREVSKRLRTDIMAVGFDDLTMETAVEKALLFLSARDGDIS
jgi:hypothetical protein